MAEAEIVQLYKSNHRDPVACLRAIADEIEAGGHGEVGCVGIVVMGNTVEVFGGGPDSEAPAVAVLLQAGAMRLVGLVESHGRD